MNDEVQRFLAWLNGARDLNPHFQEIDRWIAEGCHDRLDGLITALIPMASHATPDRWQFQSLLNHVRGQLALTPGRRPLALLLRQLISEGMPTPQLRETAARFADAHEPEAIATVLEECDTKKGLAEFSYVLAHEAVLRGKIDDTTPIAIRLAARMREEKHALAMLPLRLLELETEVSFYLPRYSSNGSSNRAVNTFDGSNDDRSDAPAGSEPSPTFHEITNAERAERVVAVVQTWRDGSNGMFEVRFFEFEEPISAPRITPSLLQSLGLECLAKVSDRAIKLKPGLASQGFGDLFCAAANGGAYTSGEGGAYGRLAAWQSLSALTGCSLVEIIQTSDCAKGSSWFSFGVPGGWFYDVAWDLGLAALSQDGKFLTVFAATDTD